MIRKVILLLILILNFVFIQDTVFAQDKEFYLSDLQKKVELNWFIPQNSTDKSALANFIVNKSGEISNIEIIRSSGNKEFDESIIRAIYKASPCAPLAKNEDAISIKFFFSPDFINLAVNDGVKSNANQLFGIDGTRIITVSNVNYSDFSNYANHLQDKINSNWNPISGKEQMDAIISVKINKDGTINDMKVQKSSGKKNFDMDILDSVMKSVPLDPLPADLQVDYKDVQLNFMYEKTEDKTAPRKYVVANIKNQDGYDEYIEQVEKIISIKLKDKHYFCKKDILLEMNINKDGKLMYVKIKNASLEDNFIKKEFNRKTLLALNKTSFPPIPEKMNVNDITFNYRILTQRKRLFSNFICDYVWNFFRTGLESFCVQTPENI